MLTRDEFPGKRLVDAVIDLPFALPTIVASLVMLALYGPHTARWDIHVQQTKWGVGIALLFVTLPFVVRSVQPVLLELDRETEEAAASLGANNLDDLHVPWSCCPRCSRHCCRERVWRSRGPSASTGRWC